MPELIDRHALLKNVYDNPPEKATMTHAEWCRKCIYEAPKVEAEPVRHGRWKGWTTSKFTGKYEDYDEPVFKDYVYYTCSECYRKSAIQELYCPHCGARMDATDTNVGGKGGDDNG